MVAAPRYFDHVLSGRTRYRRSLFGKLILQVEVRRWHVQLHAPGCTTRGALKEYWRDAAWRDLEHIK